MQWEPSIEQLLSTEVKYRTSRSSGSGGQNVNKVNTKVELIFDLHHTNAFSQEEKCRIFGKLGSRITASGLLRYSAQDDRSQLRNKELVWQKFLNDLKKALRPEKKRIKTKASRSSVEKRLTTKKQNSDKKRLRKFRSDF